MRLLVAAVVCLAVSPAMAQITAPLGSEERAQQIIEQANGLSAQLFGMLEAQSAEDERTRPVEARLAEACANLFKSRPDETITNPLCYSVFLRDGLPN